MLKARSGDAWALVPSGCSVQSKMMARGICAVRLRYFASMPPHLPIRAHVLCRDRDRTHTLGNDELPFFSDIGNLERSDIPVDPAAKKPRYARPLTTAQRESHATEARACEQMCERHGRCRAWTVWGGKCYLKDCLIGERGCKMWWDHEDSLLGPNQPVNQSRWDHNMPIAWSHAKPVNKESSRYAVWGVKGCDFTTSVLEEGQCKVIVKNPIPHSALPWCEDWFGASCREIDEGLALATPCIVRRDRPADRVRMTSIASLSATHANRAQQAFASAERLGRPPLGAPTRWRALAWALGSWTLLGLGVLLDAYLDHRAGERRVRDLIASGVEGGSPPITC